MKRKAPRLDYLATERDLNNFIAGHLEESGREGEPYFREPSARAAKAAKTDKIYLAHTCHTKVPPAGIAQYINHHTHAGGHGARPVLRLGDDRPGGDFMREEAVIAHTQNKGVDEYRALMRESFDDIRRVLKPGRWASVVFHSTSDAIWRAIR